jgi:phospholipid/cholesterol/gamma-HCH transport system permease protein
VIRGMIRIFGDLATALGFQLDLLLQVAARLHHVPRRWRWVAEQLFQSAIQTIHVVLLVGLFIGMIVSLQTGIELARIGQQDQIGTIVAVSMAREMGPFITATILAATAGSSMAAELGTMAVSDELAALEVLSVDRTRFLVLPRVVALALAAPALTILCDTIGIFGGGFVAQSQLNVSFELYIDSAGEALRDLGTTFPLPKDVFGGLCKATVFGVIVSSIGCSAGLQARGGALGVGRATRQAVRDSIIAIIIANYFMTWFMYQG